MNYSRLMMHTKNLVALLIDQGYEEHPTVKIAAKEIKWGFAVGDKTPTAEELIDRATTPLTESQQIRYDEITEMLKEWRA